MGKAEISYDEVEGCTPEEVRQGEIDEIEVFQDITCHIIFDVKMDFTRKARYVANRAMTDTSVGLYYSSFVSRYSVRIALLVSTLNYLDVLACDVYKCISQHSITKDDLVCCRSGVWKES